MTHHMKPFAATLYMACVMALVACTTGYSGPSDSSGALLAAAEKAKASGKPLQIADLTGGNVRQSIDIARRIDAMGIPVILNGQAQSAGAAILLVKDLCYARSASLWFHAGSDMASWEFSWEAGTALRLVLPPNLQRWIIREGAQDYDVVTIRPAPPAPDEKGGVQAIGNSFTRWTSLRATKLAALDFKSRICTPEQLAQVER